MVTSENVFIVPIQASKRPQMVSNGAENMKYSYLILKHPLMYDVVHYIHYPYMKNISKLRLWVMNNVGVEKCSI